MNYILLDEYGVQILFLKAIIDFTVIMLWDFCFNDAENRKYPLERTNWTFLWKITFYSLCIITSGYFLASETVKIM